MRPVLQTVTIGHATFVRDIYEARRCDKPINEWINNEIAFLKKTKQKRPSNRNVIHVSDGKASLKRQKSPETMTDTQGMSKFY